MILTGLKSLYRSAVEHNFTYALFDFKKNNLVFHVFFDFSPSTYRLGFLVQNSQLNFWIDVHKGFVIKPFIEHNKFQELMNLLDLKSDPENRFKATAFFEEFNNQIPSSFSLPNHKILVHIARVQYEIEEEDKIYYLGLKTWTERERSSKNTEKTRLLYPELYRSLKDKKNISVCYTAKKKVNEESIIRSDLKKEIA